MESKGKRSRVEVDLLAELLILDFYRIVIAAMDGRDPAQSLLPLTNSHQLRRWLHWSTSQERLVRFLGLSQIEPDTKNPSTQDCFSHDICSYFNNASGGAR